MHTQTEVVCNKNTVLRKFASALQKKYILLLTATPVQNNLDELYNLVTLLQPGLLSTAKRFQQQFVDKRATLRAELDGLVAHLYGLTEAEFVHVLAAFPLVAEPAKVAAQNAYRDVRAEKRSRVYLI